MTEQTQQQRTFSFGDDEESSKGLQLQPSPIVAPRTMTPQMPSGLIPADQKFQFDATTASRDPSQEEREYIGTQSVGRLPESQQKGASWAGSTYQMLPGGMTALAGIAKGASHLGMPGWERYQTMDIPEVRKEIEATIEAAKKVQPYAGYAGTVTGLGVGATLPAVKKLPILGELSPMASGIATGATYGAGEGYLENFDPADALKRSIESGAIGGAATPVINWGANKIINMSDRMGQTMRDFASQNIPFMSGVRLSNEARQAALHAGLSPEEITALEPYLVDTYKKYGYSPEAARLARFKEFGIQPTKGMVTLDPQQLAREHASGSHTYEDMANRAQAYATERYGINLPSVSDAVDQAANRAVSKAATAKSAYEGAYKLAEQFPGGFDRNAITNVGDQIRQTLAIDSKNLSIINNPKASEALDALNKTLGVMQPVPGGNIMHRDFNAVEQARIGLNNALENATSKSDKRAIRQVIDAFDDHIENSINNGLFSGNSDALNRWKDARALFSDYSQKFGVRRSGEASGKLVNDIVSGTKSPDQVANMMFNLNTAGDATARSTGLQTYLQLSRALGPNSPEMQTIKNSFLKQMFTPHEASPQAFAEVGNRIGNFVNGSGRAFAKSIMSPEELFLAQRYGQMMRTGAAIPPQQLNNWWEATKNTGAAFMNAAGGYLAFSDPLLAGVLAVPKAVSALKSAKPYQNYLAQKPFTGPERRFQAGAAQAGPLIERALPEREENAGGRIGRASGGRIASDAVSDKLVRAAEAAKKSINSRTEHLLDQPDETIAKALDVAKRHI